MERSRKRLEEIRKERDRLQQQQERLQGQVHDVNDELHILERQRESTQKIVDEIERQIRASRAGWTAPARSSSCGRQPRRAPRGAGAPAGGHLQAGRALHLPGPARRRIVRRPPEPVQVPVPHQPAGPRPGGRRRKAPEPRGGAARRPARRPQAARSHSRGAGGGVHQVHRAGRGPCPPAGAAAQDRPDHGAASVRAAEGREPAQRPASLERARRDEARAPGGAAPVPGSITTADIGRLDWPVEGAIVYRFGRDTLPSGGIIRWNGIGIAANSGTPGGGIREGAAGGQFGTYGLTVVLEHGNGYYSVYPPAVRGGAALRQRGARPSAPSAARTSDYGPHLHFEIRARIRSRSTRWIGFGSADADQSAIPTRSPDWAYARARGLDQREQVVRLAHRGMG